jgi:hypothetical protein
MEKMRAHGLLAVLVDVDPENREDVESWYDQEHLLERASIPGFVNARRYLSLEGTPRYLALYDVLDVGVLHSDVYLQALRGNPTPWTQSAVRKFRNTSRNEYELIAAAGEKPQELAPFVFLHRFDLTAGREDAFEGRYEAEYVPALARVPGVLGVKHYRAAAGTPKYLTIAELAGAEVAKSDAWQKLDATLDKSAIENALHNLGQFVNAVHSPA